MVGKKKCSILKEIRAQIAAANDIPYETKECTHRGKCSGTCPRCESEVRYLENQLQKRASLGKPVKIAALCAGVSLAVTGCSVVENFITEFEPRLEPEITVLDGEVAWINEPEEENIVQPTATPVSTINLINDLSGMVAYDDWDYNG